jgi:hypothetical protein
MLALTVAPDGLNKGTSCSRRNTWSILRTKNGGFFGKAISVFLSQALRSERILVIAGPATEAEGKAPKT